MSSTNGVVVTSSETTSPWTAGLLEASAEGTSACDFSGTSMASNWLGFKYWVESVVSWFFCATRGTGRGNASHNCGCGGGEGAIGTSDAADFCNDQKMWLWSLAGVSPRTATGAKRIGTSKRTNIRLIFNAPSRQSLPQGCQIGTDFKVIVARRRDSTSLSSLIGNEPLTNRR